MSAAFPTCSPSANAWQDAHVCQIRELTEEDLPAVVGLFERVFPEHRWPSRQGCERYFHEIFFANPWRDLGLPSWVAQEGGVTVAFAGVLPRRMLFGSRPLKVAVGSQFLVHPEWRHSLVAVQLLKRVLRGAQDLFVTDGANEQMKRLWLAVGGTVPILQNLEWTRLLRPTRYLLDKSRTPRPLHFAARAPCALADAVAARLKLNRFDREDDGVADEALDAGGMFRHLPEVVNGANPLRSNYDRDSLAWLFGQVAHKARHGRLRARAVHERGRLLGWFIYYAHAGTINEVLQLAACEGGFDRVLRRLFSDAWRQGATAVRGHLDPVHLQHLSDRHCWMRREGAWTLIYSRHADLLTAIERGTAGISRLDGEWWQRFIGG
jgi:GNAT acetyltransferase-like protein